MKLSELVAYSQANNLGDPELIILEEVEDDLVFSKALVTRHGPEGAVIIVLAPLRKGTALASASASSWQKWITAAPPNAGLAPWWPEWWPVPSRPRRGAR